MIACAQNLRALIYKLNICEQTPPVVVLEILDILCNRSLRGLVIFSLLLLEYV